MRYLTALLASFVFFSGIIYAQNQASRPKSICRQNDSYCQARVKEARQVLREHRSKTFPSLGGSTVQTVRQGVGETIAIAQ